MLLRLPVWALPLLIACEGTAPSKDTDDTAADSALPSECAPACTEPSPGTDALSSCVDGACTYTCEPGTVDADGDWILPGTPNPDGNGCELACEPSNGGVETCNGKDDDCNGVVDDVDVSGADASVAVWFLDADSDGEGTSRPAAGEVRYACEAPEGFVASNTDCNDADAMIRAGADERCDGVDRNCDGIIDGDDAVDAPSWYVDADDDDHGADPALGGAQPLVQCVQPAGHVATGADCDDDDPTIFRAWAVYLDVDGDGFRGPLTAICGDDTLPEHASETPTTEEDCDDDEAAVRPDAAEVCDGVDTNCDGGVDLPIPGDAPTWYVDCDGDGFAVDDTSSVMQCAPPAPDASCTGPDASWTDRVPTGGDVDCVPGDGRAFPRQGAFFADPIPEDLAPTGQLNVGDTIQVATLIWDFDCDHTYTRERTAVNGTCTAVGPNCSGSSGWGQDTVPYCGVQADWQQCVVVGTIFPSCDASRPSLRQGCR